MVKDPKNLKLPKSGLFILKIILSYSYTGNIVGDFEEEYKVIRAQHGRSKAFFWFWKHIIVSMPSLINNSFLWRYAMFKNYLKTAARNFTRNKLNSLINLISLSVGIAGSILIFLFIRNDITYDTFHERSEDIYLITRLAEGQWGTKYIGDTPAALGPELINDYPEIEYGFRLLKATTSIKQGSEENREDLYFADPAILNVFNFNMIAGGDVSSLDSPDRVLLSKGLYEKYFSDIDILGENIQLKISGNYESFTIAGIYENFPENSSVKPEMILPFEKARIMVGEEVYNDWQRFTSVFIVRLVEGTNSRDLQNKFPDIIEKYDLHKDMTTLGVGKQTGTLVPFNLSEFHLNSQIVEKDILEPQSSSIYSVIMGGLGILIISIACINFMNLSISQSIKRAKEVGIRKVIGAYRKQLIHQFYIETISMSAAALAAGLLLARLLLPLFNSLSEKNLVLDFRADIGTLTALSIGIIVLGLLSGSYPAFFLSRFRPAAAFREVKGFGGSSYVTRALIIVQFTLSVILIVSSLNMKSQLDYIKNKDLGYNKSNLVVISARGNMINTLKQELASSTNILGVGAASAGIYRNFVGMQAFRDATNDAFVVYQTFSTDHEFADIIGLELTDGRFFSIDHPTDSSDAVIINEAMAKLHNLEQPVGSRIRLTWNRDFEVIGVVRDFHYKSLHNEIQPIFIRLRSPEELNRVYLRLNGSDIEEAINEVEGVWKSMNPQQTFSYRFVDESLNLLYTEDSKWSKIIVYSMVFAILIACLGLYGMASLIAVHRTREFGVRKVLGASVARLLGSFNLEFMVLIVIANAAAWPICYAAIGKWLENFAYRADITFSSFILGGIISLVITLLSISIHALKASLADPVTTLQSD